MTTGTLPRRWSEEIDGIRWLPRLIDKVRMRERGELGAYLVGHSPVDAAFLNRVGLTTEEFVALVGTESGDAGVLAALRARGFDEERLRRWSERFPQTYKTYIALWDLDEGYRTPSAFERVALAAFKPVEGAAMALVRRVRRAP
jgi:hypothetical protein